MQQKSPETPSRMKVALVAIACNEENYLKEWTDYHLRVGFDEIFVYQNNWRYTRGDITDPRVHLEILDGKRMQNTCYNNFIAKYHAAFDFGVFIDVDEFFYMKGCRDVGEFLTRYIDEPSLFVNWRIFGDSGLTLSDGNRSVIQRFNKMDRNLDVLGKQILNFRVLHDDVYFHNPHILKRRSTRARHRSRDPSLKRTVCGGIMFNRFDEPCEIYHFRDKTWEEYLERKYNTDDAFFDASRMKGRRDLNTLRSDFRKYNRNYVENNNLKELMTDHDDNQAHR